MHQDYGSFSLKRGRLLILQDHGSFNLKMGHLLFFLEIGIMGRLLSRGRLLIFTNEDSGVVYLRGKSSKSIVIHQICGYAKNS